MSKGHGRFNITGGYHILINAPSNIGAQGYEIVGEQGHTIIHARSIIDARMKQSKLPCTVHQLYAWAGGKLIQEAMPHLTASQCEFVMTGMIDDEFEEFVGKKPELRKCQRCGEMRECTFSHCPYDEELHPERVNEGDEQWRCEECIQFIGDEI